MRAAVHDRYGPPEVLRLEDVARFTPAEDEVLVMVYATTVTPTLGMEFAGTVAEVGSAVGDFEIGDEVFETGAYRPVIDRTYPLHEVVAAAQSVETEQKTGNVVLTVRSFDRD